MDTTTIIAIILGIITVITVVVVIVIQNKRPTPSPPTTDCEWKEGKWEIDNNTQMNLQDNNECSNVTGNCGQWKRNVTCTSSNGLGNCTDNDCTGTKPVSYIDCGHCTSPPPSPPAPPTDDNIIKVGDKVKLLYKSHDGKWNEFHLGGWAERWFTDDGSHWYNNNIPYLIVSVDRKQLGEQVTQQDEITLKFEIPDNVPTVMSRWDQYLYLVDQDNFDSDPTAYITKFYIRTKDTNGINDDVLRENTDYILQDARDTGNFLDNNSKNYYVVFKLRDDPSFDPRIIKLQQV